MSCYFSKNDICRIIFVYEFFVYLESHVLDLCVYVSKCVQ